MLQASRAGPVHPRVVFRLLGLIRSARKHRAIGDNYRDARARFRGGIDRPPLHRAGILPGGFPDHRPDAAHRVEADWALGTDFLGLYFAWVHDEVEPIADPACGGRLTDGANRRTGGDPSEKPLDVLGIELDAAVADISSNAVRLVGAVDQVALPSKIQRDRAERVIGARRDRCRPLWSFGADRGRWVPSRICFFLPTAGRTERCRFADLAHPNGQ